MAFSNKFQPKSKATADVKKVPRPTLVLKMKETGAERSCVLAFLRETTSKKKADVKYFIGEVAERDDNGNIVKDPTTGWSVGTGTIFMFFPKKDGGQLVMKTEGQTKGDVVAELTFKPNDKGAVYSGKDDEGNAYYLDKPLEK
jgi:hypothetical protein